MLAIDRHGTEVQFSKAVYRANLRKIDLLVGIDDFEVIDQVTHDPLRGTTQKVFDQHKTIITGTARDGGTGVRRGATQVDVR
ncbi:hypothetical protein D3C84_1204120 [compost metagenome]